MPETVPHRHQLARLRACCAALATLPPERAVAGKQSVGVEGGEVFDGAPVGGGVVLERAVQALRSGDAETS